VEKGLLLIAVHQETESLGEVESGESMRFSRGRLTEVLQNWKKGRPLLRITGTELIHEDQMIGSDSLMGSFPWTLMTGSEGLAYDVPNAQNRHHLPVDDTHHFLTPICTYHIRDYSRTEHASHYGPTEVSDFQRL